MQHRLDPLLRPKSVAVFGASARPDSVGDWILRNLQRGGYAGRIYRVNVHETGAIAVDPLGACRARGETDANT